MRILIINTELDGEPADLHTLDLARGLAQGAHEIILAIPDHARLSSAARAIRGLHVEGFDLRRPLWPRALASLIRRRRPQVLHAPRVDDGWIASLAAARARCDTAVVLSPGAGVLQAGMTRLLGQGAVRPADTQALPGAKIDTLYFKPSATRAAEQRAEWGIGADSLIVACALPTPRGSPAQRRAARTTRTVRALVLPRDRAGQVQVPEDLSSRWIELKVPVSPQWMAAVDVLLVTDLYDEALARMQLLRAMACGSAVIAPRSAAWPLELAEAGGVLVDPRLQGGWLREALGGLVGNLTEFRARRAHGRAWVEARHSLNVLAQQALAVYQDAVSR